MFRIWITHYALIKGVYRKKNRMSNTSARALTTFCSTSFFLFLASLLLDSSILKSIFDKNLPLGPIVMGITLITSLVVSPFYKPKVTCRKIRYIRRVVRLVEQTNRYLLISYTLVYLILFFLSIIIIAKRTI